MKAGDLLAAKKLVTCSPSSTLQDAARLMWEDDVGWLPVMDAERRPIGTITDRDICMAALTQGGALRESRVSSAMSKQVLTCHADTPIGDVERLMEDAQIRRVPVVDARGLLIGVLTLADIAHAAEAHRLRGALHLPRIAKTLSAVTERRSEAS